MNYIAITRASTDEQRKKGNSHPTQERHIKNHFKTSKWRCITTVNETISGWKKEANRTQIDQLYQFCKNNIGAVDYLLFQKVDRFYRNTERAWSTIEKFQKVGVEINFVEQWISYDAPGAYLQLNIYLGLAQEESRNTSRRVKQNLETVKRHGYYIAARPLLGYTKIKAAGTRRFILTDDGTGKLQIIQQLFQQYLKGERNRFYYYKLYREQLNIQKAQFYKLYSKPAYSGHLIIESGHRTEYIKAKWEGIITLDQYKEMQILIEKEKSFSKNTNKNLEKYWLKNVLLCNQTGERMTASKSKGKYSYYEYYHTNLNKGQRISVKDAHSIINETVSNLELVNNDVVLKAIEKETKTILKEQQSGVVQKKAAIQNQVNNLTERQTGLKNLLIDNSLTIEEYRELKSHIEKKLAEQYRKLERVEKIRIIPNVIVNRIVKKIPSLFKNFETANYIQKERLLRILFPEGFYIDNQQIKGVFNYVILPFINEKSTSSILFDNVLNGGHKHTVIEHHFKIIEKLIA